MPGYVIHLAVAQEYLKKHSDIKEDYTEEIVKEIERRCNTYSQSTDA